MIKSFRSKALQEVWDKGSSRRIAPNLHKRIAVRLDLLDSVVAPEGMNVASFNFHALHGKPQRYTVHVNGPWCITFEWDGTDVLRVDLEQYH
jgi:proteic killer suppression protein